MTEKAKNISEDYVELFTRIKNETATDMDYERFDSLLQTDPSFARQVDELETLWSELELFPAELLLNEDFSLSKNYKSDKPDSFFYRSLFPYGKKLALIAAAVVLASLIGFQYQHYVDRDDYVTERGERIMVNLADDSVVHVNANTKISIKIDKRKRDIKLSQGEVLFDVARDENRKFVVSTQYGTVEALGTSFNVNSLPDKFVVTVVEGSVVVSNKVETEFGHLTQVATKSQQISVHSDGRLSSKVLDDVKPIISWAESKLVFSGEDLQFVIEQLNKYSKHRVEVQDARLRVLPIYGVFNAGDTRGFLAALERSYPVHQVLRSPELTELVYMERN